MNVKFFENLVEQKLLGLHTCYLATVISAGSTTANIQPLSLVKAVNSSAKKQSIINNVPVSAVVTRSLVENETLAGKTVIVACMERDISQTRKGLFFLPSLRRHSLSDSIIIGFL